MGLEPATATKAPKGTFVLEQRGLFHTRRTVADTCREERNGEEHKATRTPLMEHARAVSQAQSAQEARGRLAVFAPTWRARTPNAVATFERDCAQKHRAAIRENSRPVPSVGRKVEVS